MSSNGRRIEGLVIVPSILKIFKFLSSNDPKCCQSFFYYFYFFIIRKGKQHLRYTSRESEGSNDNSFEFFP